MLSDQVREYMEICEDLNRKLAEKDARIAELEQAQAWPCDGYGDESGHFVCKKDVRIAELTEALKEIATQKLCSELDSEEIDGADWMEGYESCVMIARRCAKIG